MVFANKSYGVATPADRFAQATKKRPVLYFGLPFLLTVVIGSFALSELTATKYNVHDNRTKAVRFDSSPATWSLSEERAASPYYNRVFTSLKYQRS